MGYALNLCKFRLYKVPYNHNIAEEGMEMTQNRIRLARNNSRIIGVVVNDHEKYECRVLEDGFVMSSLNALSHEVKERTFGFQRISRSSALMITWQAEKAILPSQRFIRKPA